MKKETTTIITAITLNDGHLGSHIEEERSEMRYVV